MRKRFSH